MAAIDFLDLTTPMIIMLVVGFVFLVVCGVIFVYILYRFFFASKTTQTSVIEEAQRPPGITRFHDLGSHAHGNFEGEEYVGGEGLNRLSNNWFKKPGFSWIKSFIESVPSWAVLEGRITHPSQKGEYYRIILPFKDEHLEGLSPKQKSFFEPYLEKIKYEVKLRTNAIDNLNRLDKRLELIVSPTSSDIYKITEMIGEIKGNLLPKRMAAQPREGIQIGLPEKEEKPKKEERKEE